MEEAAFTPHLQPDTTTPATTHESRAHVPVGGRRAHPRKEEQVDGRRCTAHARVGPAFHVFRGDTGQ